MNVIRLQKVLANIKVQTLPLKEIERQIGQPITTRLGAKIAVNHIRHRLTKYDAALDEARGYQNHQEVIRQHIYTAIAQTYAHVPAIVQECERQMRGATANDLNNMAYRKGRAT